MIWRIAWRNLGRNPRRTAITVSAVAMSIGLLIASLALMRGMLDQFERNATQIVVGDAQAHAAGYLKDRSLYKSIAAPEALLAKAGELGILAAPRSFGYGLVSHGSKSAGAAFWGVDPAAERAAVTLPRQVMAGRFLADLPGPSVAPQAGEAPPIEVVIGRKLAKSLHVEVGAELVAVVQAADGSLGNELLQVAGIFKGVGEQIDRGGVMLRRDDYERLFVTGGRVHEIAFVGRGRAPAEVIARLAPAAGGAELKTWQQLLPAISDMLSLSFAMIYIFVVVFMLAAGIGVLNTMLMATHDRVRELGVCRALGATPWRIVLEITAESFVLSLISAVIGLAIGLAGGAYFQVWGLDLAVFGDVEFGFAGIVWDALWLGRLTVGDVAASVVGLCLACVLASLYPAIKAARLDPASAMTQV